jgi:hypothetical protein
MKEPEDHRIRVAAERRNETQERLLLSGLILGSEKPVKEISIEEIYTHAETSRGTFYKYFTGTTGLFKALGLNVANQIVEFLSPLKPSFADPAIAIASMTRLGIRLAVNIPMLGRLLLQTEWPSINKNTGILKDIEMDIKLGIKQGRFSDIPVDIGLGIVVGSTKAAVVNSNADPRFVGGHPLAGAETGGPGAARADLFKESAFVILPFLAGSTSISGSLVATLGMLISLDPAGTDGICCAVPSYLDLSWGSMLGSLTGGNAGRVRCVPVGLAGSATLTAVGSAVGSVFPIPGADI